MLMNHLGMSSSLLGYRPMTEILTVMYCVSISKKDVRKTLSNQKKNISHYWTWLYLLHRWKR